MAAARSKRSPAEGFLHVVRALERTGFDRPTTTWLDGYVRYLTSGKRDFVVRKGRGARGTTTGCMWALSHALYASWKRRPGTLTIGVIMSNTLANGRDIIAKLRDMCERLKIPHEATSERVRLLDVPWEFRLYAAQPNAALGIEIGLVLLDEASAMQNDSGANPLRVIIERLTPRMRDPMARMVIMSAPYSTDDHHAAMFERGETHTQSVLHVPTWDGNPEETEESCQQAATDEPHFQMAFAAVPTERTASPPFKREDIDFALSEGFDRGKPIGRRVVACDPSSGTGGDSFVRLVAGVNERADGTPIVVVDLADGEHGKWAHRKGGGEVLATIARDAKDFGALVVHSDQREAALMKTELPRHGLNVVIHVHSNDSKAGAVEMLNLWLENGRLGLPHRNGGRIRRQLLDYQTSETRTGQKRFGGRGKRPDDYVSALLTLAMADKAGHLEGSVNARRRRKDPPPSSGLPLQSASPGFAPSVLDRVEFGPNGEAFVRRERYRSPIEGGGF